MLGIYECEMCHGQLMESYGQYSFVVNHTSVTVNAVPTVICTQCRRESYAPEVDGMLAYIYSALSSRDDLPDYINMSYGEDPYTVE